MVFLLVISTGLFVLFEFKARDLVYNTVDNELEIIAQNSMDNAVLEVLSEYVTDYNDLENKPDLNQFATIDFVSEKIGNIDNILATLTTPNIS